jgi:hypothetical protein
MTSVNDSYEPRVGGAGTDGSSIAVSGSGPALQWLTFDGVRREAHAWLRLSAPATLRGFSEQLPATLALVFIGRLGTTELASVSISDVWMYRSVQYARMHSSTHSRTYESLVNSFLTHHRTTTRSVLRSLSGMGLAAPKQPSWHKHTVQQTWLLQGVGLLSVSLRFFCVQCCWQCGGQQPTRS